MMRKMRVVMMLLLLVLVLVDGDCYEEQEKKEEAGWLRVQKGGQERASRQQGPVLSSPPDVAVCVDIMIL